MSESNKVLSKYIAFISYRHADNVEEDRQWATWLHEQLETYNIPVDLVGTTNLRGDKIPPRIYPVFRDEESLPADSSLATAITQALDDSQFLVILCSPRAMQSYYLQQEIIHFKASGKSNRVIAAILLGEPNASTDTDKAEDPEDVRTLECFPESLRYEVDTSGVVQHHLPTEPIAADFRLLDGSKGFTNLDSYRIQLLESGVSRRIASKLVEEYKDKVKNAKLKIIASILGVRLEVLAERDRLRQLRLSEKRVKSARLLATVVSGLLIVALASAYIAWLQRHQAIELRQLAEQNLIYAKEQAEEAKRQEKLAKDQRANAKLNEINALSHMSKSLSLQGQYSDAWRIAFSIWSSAEKDNLPRFKNTLEAMNFAFSNRTEQARTSELEGDINIVEYNPTLDALIILTTAGLVHVWDRRTGTTLHSFYHNDSVRGAKYVHSSNKLLSWSYDGSAVFWDLNSGERALEFSHGSTLNNVNLVKNDSLLITSSLEGKVKIWDTTSGNEILGIENNETLHGVKYIEELDGVLTWSMSGAKLWDRKTGAMIHNFPHGINPNIYTSPTIDFEALFIQKIQTLITSGPDNTVKIWDIKNGKALGNLVHDEQIGNVEYFEKPNLLTVESYTSLVIWSLEERKRIGELVHKGPVLGSLFLDNYQKIITWDIDKQVLLWDVASGRQIAKLPHNSNVYEVIPMELQDRLFIRASDGSSSLWDLQGNKISSMDIEGSTGRVIGARYLSHKGHLLTWSTDGVARLWSIRNGENISEMIHTDHPKGIKGALLVPDIDQVFTWSDGSKTGRLWDPYIHFAKVILGDETNKPPKGVLHLQNKTNSMSEKSLLWYETGVIEIWDRENGDKLVAMRHQPGKKGLKDVRYLPKSNRLLSWANDKTLRIWNAENGQQETVLKHFTDVVDITYHEHVDRLLTKTHVGFYLWSVESGQLIADYGKLGSFRDAIYLEESNRVIFWDDENMISILDVESNSIEYQVQHGASIFNNEMEVRFLPKKGKLVSWSNDGSLHVWSATKLEELVRLAYEHDEDKQYFKKPLGMEYIEESDRILIWSKHGGITLWDALTGKKIIEVQHAKNYGEWVAGGQIEVSYNSYNDTLFSWSDLDNSVRIWDVNTGDELVALHHKDWLHGAVDIGEINMIATWHDETINLWNKDTNEVEFKLKHDSPSIIGISYIPEYNWILSWGADGTARLWDASSGIELAAMRHGTDISGVEFIVDQKEVVTWSESDAGVKIWRFPWLSEISNRNMSSVFQIACSRWRNDPISDLNSKYSLRLDKLCNQASQRSN